ncbi:MAG: dTDP-4-dehydrorhamnose reductase [Flavobacterium sp.]
MVVAVTGASGQLGQALQHIAPEYPNIKFIFAASAQADITNKASLSSFFQEHKPDFCINAAAYTAVDKAESEPEKAHFVNAVGAKNLAEVCNSNNTTLLHISTDFVFDGTKDEPYTEEDLPNPQSAYGKTKLQGENEIRRIAAKYFIIRTSWVYSQFSNNFMKTMIRLGNERDTLSVVNDQTGTPTNAVDLAQALILIILSNKSEYGIYNYSNEGSCTWYEFAKEIFRINNMHIDLQPIPTSAYPTPAKRPVYSVLCKNKISTDFLLDISHWRDSLARELAK